ncbi:MAG: diaminopimelate epimerase [bacterium]|jgi:diaminopimelate epimerase
MPEPVPFTKMQGVGNDFVVVDARDLPSDVDYAAFASEICDRHFGAGADGLMVFALSTVADFRARMFNPDGTEDFCGNGTRCLLRFVSEKRLHPLTPENVDVSVETKAGIRHARIHRNENGIFQSATLSMGVPQFAPEQLPMYHYLSPVIDYLLPVGDETIPISVVSTGTTHTIIWTDDLISEERFLRLSPLIENHPIFPERTSVLWTMKTFMIGDPNELLLRIWERGVGETLGCGSGACAAAAIARLTNKISPQGNIPVFSKGGRLDVQWGGNLDEEIYLTGSAETVYESVWNRFIPRMT